MLIGAMVATAVVAQTETGLRNGSFEERPKGQPEIPSHWEISAEDSRVKMSPRRARSGRVSLGVDNAGPESSARVSQRVPAAAWRNQLVRISGWYRREGVRRTPGALSLETLAGGEPLSRTASGEQLGAASRWTMLEAVVFVAPEATELEIRFEVAGAGDVWLDDLKLEAVTLESNAPSPQVRRYLEDAIALIRRNALVASERDWRDIEREAVTLAAGAREPADAYPALQYIVSRLNTPGSRFEPPGAVPPPAEGALETPSARVERGQFGVVGAPSLIRATAEQAQQYIDQAHAVLAQLEVQSVCSYVLDLRGTTGDDVIPLLGAFSPLLGEGRVGGLVDSTGGTSFLRAVKGDIRDDNGVLARPARAAQVPSRPLAVLFDEETAGAGESLAVAFHGKGRVRSFGMDTAGRPSQFRQIALSDGAQLIVAATYPADRLGRVFTETLKPDVRVRPGLGRDRALRRALDWLAEQDACRR